MLNAFPRRVATGGGFLPAAAKGTHYDGLLALVDWYVTVCALAGIPSPRSNTTEGVPPLDGHDVYEAVVTGGTSPRTEHVYNVDCEKPMSAKTCAEAGSEAIGAIRDAAGLKLLVGSPGPTDKGAIQPVPDWVLSGDGLAKYLPAGTCNAVDQGGCVDINATVTRWGQNCSQSSPCLFDLNADPTESVNIAQERPEDTARLLARFRELAATQFRMVNTTADEAAMVAMVRKTGYYLPFAS